MSDDRTELESELRRLLDAGRKIDAIKLYCERTGAGLAEAKEAVESLQGVAPTGGEGRDAGLEEEVVRLLQQRRKIEAIKLYRQRTGLGLKEAKDAVEAIARDQHIEIPSGPGCAGVLLAVLAVGAGVIALL